MLYAKRGAKLYEYKTAFGHAAGHGSQLTTHSGHSEIFETENEKLSGARGVSALSTRYAFSELGNLSHGCRILHPQDDR